MLSAAAAQTGQPPSTPTAAPCDQSPANATKYTALLAGNRAGIMTVWHEQGATQSCFEFNDRGRGPRVRSQMRVGDDGFPIFEHIQGNEYYKGPVDEQFTFEQGRAQWKNRAESGDRKLNAPAFYASMDGPPEETAALVRAALKAPGHHLALLPAGDASVERVGDREVSANNQKQRVVQYAITGFGFSPAYVWLDEDGQYFAQVFGWFSMIRSGWEDMLPVLDKVQDEELAKRNRELARSLAHKPAGPLVIQHARLFDSESASVKPGMTVVIKGDKIEQVAPDASAKIPTGAQIINAAGKSLLPGLWDMHVHLDTDDGMLHMASGVTSVRDLGNDTDKLLAMRKSFDDGTAVGPRVVMAGLMDGRGPFAGPTKVLVDTPEEARAAVDRYAKLGYEQIKIYSSIKPELVPVITAEAHKLDLRVSGHVPAYMTAEQAVNEGYDELQHVNFLFLNFLFDKVQDTRTPARFTVPGEYAATIDQNGPAMKKFIALLQQHHTCLDPTVAAFEGMFTAKRGQVDPTFAAVADRFPVQIRRQFLIGGLTPPAGMEQRYRDSFRAMVNLVGVMYRAGIPIEAGTDGLAGFQLDREFELYTQAGIPAAKVLQIATLNAARIMRRDRQLGSITPGKLADVILVDGDPVANISDIRRVTTVIKGGVVYESAELDKALGIQPLAATGH
ncbi:MAG: amidohydrolase family protein [Terriglobales bacterium]